MGKRMKLYEKERERKSASMSLFKRRKSRDGRAGIVHGSSVTFSTQLVSVKWQHRPKCTLADMS